MRAATTAATIPVWDPVVRVLHWTLAASVLGAFLLEDARSTHRFLGYVALAVVVALALFIGGQTLQQRKPQLLAFTAGSAGMGLIDDHEIGTSTGEAISAFLGLDVVETDDRKGIGLEKAL